MGCHCLLRDKPDGTAITAHLSEGVVVGALQYSCLENLMDGGAWWAVVHGVAKSWIPTQGLNPWLFLGRWILYH